MTEFDTTVINAKTASTPDLTRFLFVLSLFNFGFLLPLLEDGTRACIF